MEHIARYTENLYRDRRMDGMYAVYSACQETL